MHSWAGIGLAKGGVDKILCKVETNSGAVQRWRETRVLVLDEVSMLDDALCDVLANSTTGTCIKEARANCQRLSEAEVELLEIDMRLKRPTRLSRRRRRLAWTLWLQNAGSGC